MYVLTLKKADGECIRGLFKALNNARSYRRKEMAHNSSVVSASIVFLPMMEGCYD